MRRAFLIGIVGIIILIGFMVSCDLFSDGTINFYRMVKGNDDVSEYRLRYRKDGWTIRMSLGQIEDTGFATKEQAEE
jgi:tRNA U34 5-carboxymethylaminomethyl modifying enzyme MnmG/GidA